MLQIQKRQGRVCKMPPPSCPPHTAAGVVCEDFARSTGSFAIANKSWGFVLLVAVVTASLSFVLPFASRTDALCVFDSHHPALRKLKTADCGLWLYKCQCQREQICDNAERVVPTTTPLIPSATARTGPPTSSPSVGLHPSPPHSALHQSCVGNECCFCIPHFLFQP